MPNDKLKAQTPDLTAANIAKLNEMFPNLITEGKVNLEALKTFVGEEVWTDECYEFTWVGKRDAVAEIGKPCRKTLRPCAEESVNFDTTENLYIEGDNLDVLKLLQESYLGKVKMVYIDPPYNTGKDSFVYPDNYRVDDEDYEENIGLYDELGNKLFKENSNSNPRFHSDWCSMIYPRLVLARNMLREDGVIFISIDFAEFENLKKICGEIFGSSNYVGEIVWQTATDNNPSQISMEHEYILCYAKNINSQAKWLIQSEKAYKINEQYKKLKLIYNSDLRSIKHELKKWVTEHLNELKGATHYTYVDEIGVYYPGNSSNTKPGGYKFDIVHPSTGKVCAKPDYGYRWTEKTFWDANSRGDVEWGETETTIPKIKKRIETVTEMLKSYYYEDNRYWTKYLNQMFGRRIFENPKSVNLLMHFLKYTSSSDDLILDFFSGSATTAHAVMQLNAEDGGNRKFILIQLPEECKQGSEAQKAGYKNICEIGKERIRRASQKIKDENPLTTQDLDVGFRVLKLDESNYKDVYYNALEWADGKKANGEQMDFDEFTENIKPDRTALDLLYTCLLEWGIDLNVPIVTENVEGYSVLNYNNGLVYAYFKREGDEFANEKLCRALANLSSKTDWTSPKVVFNDGAFEDSPIKINLFEIFKLNSPNTSVKVI